MSETRVTVQLAAPRERVYRALVDPAQVQRWRVPDGMASEIHAFDPRVGGRFRVSLTYDEPTRTGKTQGRTDTYHGHFVALEPPSRVVEAIEFESADPRLQGVMTVTYRLEAADGGTTLSATHEGLPPGVSPEDNALGWRLSLAKLAALVEATAGG